MDDKILFEIARGLSRIADCMETAQKNNRVAEPSASDNTTKATICQIIVEDIMNYFHRDTGFFSHINTERLLEVRDNLCRIIDGKL